MTGPAGPPTAGSAEQPLAAVESAERLLRQGEPLLAYNVAEEGLSREPKHLRLRQLKGLALARAGDLEQANAVLGAIAAEGQADAETLGMLARTHKDLGLAAQDPRQRERNLASAFAIYRQAYDRAREAGRHADAYYTGINAAALAVFRDDLESARVIAREVRHICGLAAAERGAPDYWLEATLGEAGLILGDEAAATAHYGAAAVLATGHFGNLSSTLRQAELLAQRLPGHHAWLQSVLRVPPVLMFTGHMIDLPSRRDARFPPEIETQVRDALRLRLEQLEPMAAYGSAACGADILCLEAMQDRGAETHVVLPFPAAEFRHVSVDIAGGGWGERFERAMSRATSVTVTSDHRASDSAATFEYSNLVFTGMARLRAQVLQARLCGIAVWDPHAPQGAGGGASSVVRLWEERGFDVQHLHLSELRRHGGAHVSPPSAIAGEGRASAGNAGAAPGFRHEIRAMLFADTVGYSSLSEDQIPTFVANFLGAVAELNRRTSFPPEHLETAGDGLYMVFPGVADAARYALELAALIRGTDWAALGLPARTQLRIALHCGPVYCGVNPLTGSPLYTGPHTSRTARIEPVTPPGQVYASSAFAAVAAAVGIGGLTMNYVGRMSLPKGYGTLPLYHLRPLDELTSDSSSTASESAKLA